VAAGGVVTGTEVNSPRIFSGRIVFKLALDLSKQPCLRVGQIGTAGPLSPAQIKFPPLTLCFSGSKVAVSNFFQGMQERQD